MVLGVWQTLLARPDSIEITSRNWFTRLGRRPEVTMPAAASAVGAARRRHQNFGGRGEILIISNYPKLISVLIISLQPDMI